MPAEKHAVFTISLFLLAALLPFLYVLFAHRRLVRRQARCEEGWRYLAADLAKRHELVPGLVELARREPSMPRDVVLALGDAGALALTPSGSMSAKAAAENALAVALTAAFRAFQKSPTSGASELRNLQEGFATNEERLHAARRFFNVGVNDFNERLRRFPNSIIATWFGLVEEEGFVIEDVQVTHPRPGDAPVLDRTSRPTARHEPAARPA